MHRATLTLLACLLTAAANADTGESPDKPTLRLIPAEWTTQVGEHISFYLVLEVPRADASIGNDGRFSFSNRGFVTGESISWPALSMSFIFQPKEAGFVELGPYSITVGDETYTTEMREFQVFPGWEPGEVGYRWQLSHELVEVGQPFGLTVRQRDIGDKPENLYLKIARRYHNSDGPFKVEGGGSVQSSSGSVQGERDRTRGQTFTITPTQPGELHLTRELFENLPEDVEVPELIVDVLEQMPE